MDARKAQWVKPRCFVGLWIEEAAEVLNVSLLTAKRDWPHAKTRLFRAIQK